METIIQKINQEKPLEEQLQTAAGILKKGGLVAFPTETVYGLGGNALDPEASAAIYAAKGRPSDNPLIVHIADTQALSVLAREVPDAAYRLTEHFWPGPLTMLLRKSSIVPKETTGGLETVGIRMPSHPVAHTLIKISGIYIAAPSANRSGKPSTTKAEHVIEDLDGRVDMIIDGGHVPIGIESTIIDLTSRVPMILRPGFITKEQLEEVIGPVEYDKAVLQRKKDVSIVAKAPGMKYRHYAPQGDLIIYEGPLAQVVARIDQQAAEYEADGEKVGILTSDKTAARYHSGIVLWLGNHEEEEQDQVEIQLFDCLREFDRLGVTKILSESFDEGTYGQAIMNRLLKAAGYQVINIS